MNLKEKLKGILNNKTSLQVIIVLLGLSLGVGIFRYIELNREKNRYLTENNLVILKYKMAQQTIDTLKNKNNELITRQKVVTSEDQASINKLSDEVFNLQKKDAKNTQTIALLKTTQQVGVDSIDVGFTETPEEDSAATAKAVENKDSAALIKFIQDSTVRVPKSVSYVDTNKISAISIDGVVTKTGFKLDSLRIPNTLDQRIVKKEGGWFKPDTYEFQSKNSSKYVNTTGEQSLLFTPKQKGTFWKIVGGIIAGAGAVLILK